MRAVVIDEFGGPEVLRLAELEKPVPAENEILVKVAYIGVGKPDNIMRTGQCPYMDHKPGNLVVGNECAGVVEAVGSAVTDFRPGMKVCVNSGLGYGSHAEYMAVPAQFALELPEEYPLQYAPGLLNYFVAYALLNEIGRGTDGRSIYITGGAGGIGTAVIQTALLEGFTVCASARSDEKCEYIKSLGAHCVFNSTKVSEKDALLEFTHGEGVDLIFDQVAGPRFASQFEYLADFGMIVLYNWMEGSPELDQLQTIIDRAAHAQAVRSFSFRVYDSKPERLAKVRKICLDRILSGQLKPRLFADLPMEECRQAHALLDGQKIMGKLIMHP